MANYNATIRTNYFRVKDPDAFRKFMQTVAAEDTVHVWEGQKKAESGEEITLFGFGVYGSIYGVNAPNENNADGPEDDDDCDLDYDEFTAGLQKHVADDDAIILFEAGNEKLRYVCGSATIITSNEVRFADITAIGVRLAKELLKNPDWETQCDY